MRYDPNGKKFPTMSRQHFELIAYVINQHGCVSKGDLVQRFISELKETNRNFDEQTFRQRCFE